MGIPYKRIICASNENNVLATFVNTGKYIVSGRTLTRTVSPSMDILTSSNIERYLYHLTDGNGALVASWMQSLAATGRFEVSPSVSTIKVIIMMLILLVMAIVVKVLRVSICCDSSSVYVMLYIHVPS